MPRLTAEQWEQARADYEVRSMTADAIGRKFGVSQQAISKRAVAEKWVRGKSCEVVNKKVQAIKDFAEAQEQSCKMGTTYNYTIDECVKERLQNEGLMLSLANTIARKAKKFADNVDTLADLESLSRVKKNLTPPAAAQNTITVQQASMSQAQVDASLSPDEVCDALIAEYEEEISQSAKKKGNPTKKTGLYSPEFDTKLSAPLCLYVRKKGFKIRRTAKT